MDKNRQKAKKENSVKLHDKVKTSFAADVKAIKENLKIKEILKTVKINSSMRIKAPRGSKVMSSDLSEVQDRSLIAEYKASSTTDAVAEAVNVELAGEQVAEKGADGPVPENEGSVDDSKSLTNDSAIADCASDSKSSDDFVLDNDVVESIKTFDEVISSVSEELSTVALVPSDDQPLLLLPPSVGYDETSIQRSIDIKNDVVCNDTLAVLPNISNGRVSRTRKLSLDHTILARESFSQSEADLHSMGKSPLERKSSFFRKKMESFLKNTSEVFRRQSIKRRGSMSYSMQSLNENSIYSGKYGSPTGSQDLHGSITSLSNTADTGSTQTSTPTSSQGSQDWLGAEAADAQPTMAADSVHSLNEALLAESLLNSRAISMSSGLDSAKGPARRQANRANRVTWLASEGLTNYLRRMIQDEKSRELSRTESARDSKGRRLSYQRAVSGEDHVRYQDTLKRALIPEQANVELTSILNEFTRSGVPSLRGFSMYHIGDEALASIHWQDFTKELHTRLDFSSGKKSPKAALEALGMPPHEESRQAVVLELVTTEVCYIRHLMSIVEVFMAAAHAIQDHGKMLVVDTERLFSNIPDVLNASLHFYEITIYPMVHDAIITRSLFNTDLMYPGFFHFREQFAPYEKLVSDQSRMVSYLRSLNSNDDFRLYLSWCHAHKSCDRLQLADLLVKPMQRLTKYGLLLRRIAHHTETEPEKTTLTAMEAFAKNYVLDLNRSIRQRDELEKLDQLIEMIDVYEIDFKDEDLDCLFRAYSTLNLKAPMVGCLPHHSRSLIYQGDLKFKDAAKETKVRTCGMDVHAFLLTDMLLICKKMNVKGSPFSYKLIRPKFMVDKMIHFYQFNKMRPNKDPVGLLFIVTDEVGSAFNSFALSDPSKEGNPAYIKTWESKLREAKLTYDLGVSYAKDPSRDLSEVEMDSSSEYMGKPFEFLNTLTRSVSLPDNIVLCTHPSSPDRRPSEADLTIERDARERVAAMLHRSMGASTDPEFSQASMNTDSFDATSTSGQRSLRHPMYRTSTGGSSRQSRLSSFQQSTSAASHDEPALLTRNIYRAGSSVEHHIPPKYADEGVTSITVNVVSESESDTMVPKQVTSLPGASRPVSRSASTTKQHTLKVQPQSGVMALVHSLPDLTIDPSPRSQSLYARSPSPQSASDKLYQSHHELLNRNRLSASAHGHYLHPDHRGKSYPPPSPTSRGSLKRGLAFSYSFKYPPLSKMGHVNSQSQQPAEPTTSKESLKSDKSREEEEQRDKSKDEKSKDEKAKDDKAKEDKEKKKDKGKTKAGQKGKQSKSRDKDKEKGKDKEKDKDKDKDKEREKDKIKERDKILTDVKPDDEDGNIKDTGSKADPQKQDERAAFTIDPGDETHDGLQREKPERERFFDRLRHRGKSMESEPGTVNPLLVPGTSKEDPPQPPPSPTGFPSARTLKGFITRNKSTGSKPSKTADD